VEYRDENLPELTPASQKDRENSTNLSADFYIDESDPPTLLLHGAADERVPVAHAESTHQLLLANGVQTNLIVIPGVGHDPPRILPQTRGDVLEWFRRYLVEE
jgi:acylaminoacyl-peptidase